MSAKNMCFLRLSLKRGKERRKNIYEIANVPYVFSRESYKDPMIWMTEFSAPAEVLT